jgi:hypothetical protein
MAIDINIPSQVKNYANLAAFPATGTLKTIFIANDTNKTYRWTGSVYVEISGTDTSSLVPASRTLTINGTTQDLSADRTFTISTGITIGTTAITSGTVGRVLFEGTGNVVQESANLFWDNTNGRLGIGTSTPDADLNILRTQNASTSFNIKNLTNGAGAESRINFQANSGTFSAGKTSTGYTPYKILTANCAFLSNTTGDISFLNDAAAGRILMSAGSSSTANLAIATTGNVLINTTTDAGFKLDVNGTARVSGQLSSGITGTNGNVGIRRTADGGIVGSFYTDGTQTIVKEHTGTGGVLLNGFDTTSLKWMGNSSQPRVGIGFNGTISATCHIKGAFATSATSSLLIENSAGTAAMRVRDDLVILLPSLPTSPTGLPTGAIWNNLGILTIV